MPGMWYAIGKHDIAIYICEEQSCARLTVLMSSTLLTVLRYKIYVHGSIRDVKHAACLQTTKNSRSRERGAVFRLKNIIFLEFMLMSCVSLMNRFDTTAIQKSHALGLFSNNNQIIRAVEQKENNAKNMNQ